MVDPWYPSEIKYFEINVLNHVMAGLVPAIHALETAAAAKAWMPGTRLVLGPREARTRGSGMRGEEVRTN